jgi:hypothetical protein
MFAPNHALSSAQLALQHPFKSVPYFFTSVHCSGSQDLQDVPFSVVSPNFSSLFPRVVVETFEMHPWIRIPEETTTTYRTTKGEK